jgi:hypothetical protein
MAKFSKKMMGKEVGDASVYAQPHTMSGKPVKVESQPGSGPVRNNLSTVNMSVGGHDAPLREYPVKTSGIVVRGGKAQTKGRMARGPMA